MNSKNIDSQKTRKVPTLDLQSFTNGSNQEQKKFVEDFYEGLVDYGFVILKNHGISEELLKSCYSLSEKFFSYSTEIKNKYGNIIGGQRGYTPFGKEHAKDAEVMDLKEFWHIGNEIDKDHPLKSFFPDNVWPEEIPEFKNTFSALYKQFEKTGKIMLQALTAPLDVDINYFDQIVDEGNSILRLLHYPPIPKDADPRCIRAAAHEDINLITILPAATTSGLQLKDRDGKWLDIDSNWGDLIVDAGDMLSRITNDIIPATTHRVINPQDGKNESRYSMPFFMHPRPDALLSVIHSCRGSGVKYPDILAHEALLERLREIGLVK